MFSAFIATCPEPADETAKFPIEDIGLAFLLDNLRVSVLHPSKEKADKV